MQIKHFLITETTDGLFKLEGPTFYTVGDLMDYHVTHQIPLTIKSGCVIKRPINRQKWELSPQDIDLKEKIGRGNFGDVFKGHLKLSPGRVPLEVAVKTCKINLPDEQKQKFIREGRILQQYSHENIVKFIGISITSNGPIMLIMELVGGGSLLSYLRENRSSPDKVSVRELLRMSLDAASGMRYLESKNVIHRDLAARNCLISTGGHVKISDFGMSREAVDEEYTVSNGLKQIPVKWTAPEALNYGRYTSLCDVWSFGILLWEIFTLGSVPYAGMTNTKTREMIDNGYRLPSPPSCPVLVYQLMKTSWSYEPDERIRFEKIYPLLEDIYKSFVKFNPK
ncbi:Tyrosine-protein kinase transforming protein Fes [Halotydeus destructor]|nr:Tyrosine-protein kinase transforming protein Fes [Halotydeus destructor]